jgi:hypothetical protein
MFVLPTFSLGVVGSPVVPPFNVETQNTEANIGASTPTNPAGEVNIAFGTDTKDFYIYYDGDWYIFNNDS